MPQSSKKGNFPWNRKWKRRIWEKLFKALTGWSSPFFYILHLAIFYRMYYYVSAMNRYSEDI
jgi:hypothetical protein